MQIGQRLRDLREEKKFSQGDIEKATGLLRCYVSRVENGHTVPSVDTLEKWARALEMPLYQLMHDGNGPPKPRKLTSESDKVLWGNSGEDATELNKLRRYLAKVNPKERIILLGFAAKLARRVGK
jgi:transcriptional regulator with XRE-family HTH domain